MEAVQFILPDSSRRRGALGPIEGLPQEFRKALEPRQDLQPVPVPRPADWLANQPEAGQTFRAFVFSHPNRPDSQCRKFYLQPIGTFAQPCTPGLKELVRFATAFFAMEIRLLPPIAAATERIRTRRNPPTCHTQLWPTDLIELLGKHLPHDAFALLGITMVDLYPAPDWNFVLGQALLRDRVGISSFARYDPALYGAKPSADVYNLMLRRSCKVLAPEASHMFGTEHCIWYRCLMNGSNHLEESDARPLHPCPVDLRKLQWSIGFDVARRYRSLLDLDRATVFSDEGGWIQKRPEFIRIPTS